MWVLINPLYFWDFSVFIISYTIEKIYTKSGHLRTLFIILNLFVCLRRGTFGAKVPKTRGFRFPRTPKRQGLCHWPVLREFFILQINSLCYLSNPKTTGRGYTQTYCASPLNHCSADEVDNNDFSFVFGFSVYAHSVTHTFP